MYKLNSTVHCTTTGRCNTAAAAATVVMFEGVRLVSSEYTTCIECQVTTPHYCSPDWQ